MIPHYNTMFWTTCDGCGATFSKKGAAMLDLSAIETEMKNKGWTISAHSRTIRCKECSKKKTKGGKR